MRELIGCTFFVIATMSTIATDAVVPATATLALIGSSGCESAKASIGRLLFRCHTV